MNIFRKWLKSSMMLNIPTFLKISAIGIYFFFSQPIWAESAPVYDADSLPQQFYNAETEQDGSSSDSEHDSNAFVPPPPRDAAAQNMRSLESPTPVPPPTLTNDQRIKRLEQQISNLQTSDSSQRLESLQKQVQTLRAQVEQLTHQLQQLQQSQDQHKNAYIDNSKQLAEGNEEKINHSPETKIANKKAMVTTKTVTTQTTKMNNDAHSNDSETESLLSVNQPDVAEEQQIYQTAYDLIKSKKYTDAVNALQKMLKKYPSGQFASNAHYWLGELYGLLDKRSQALAEFNIVTSRYPESPRVSDAQLKIGLIHASDSKWAEAKTAFKKVINRYPGTSSSRLALEQLKQIKQAGH